MKRFLLTVLFGTAGAVVLVVGAPILRIALAQSRLDAEFRLPEGTTVLCTGDSHVGCTFVEVPEFHNKVLWQSASSPLFTLLRLRNLHRLGQLDRLQTVITEVGHQTIYAEQSDELRTAAWKNSFPWAWRSQDHWPKISILFDCLQPQTIPGANEGVPQIDLPLSSRSKSEQEEAFCSAMDSHFARASALGHARAESERKTRAELAALRDFCRAHNLRLILFSSPVTSDYWARRPLWGKASFAEMQAWLRDEGFEYHDCTTLLDDDWFRDAHHLRPAGAKTFTRWFFENVVRRETAAPLLE